MFTNLFHVSVGNNAELISSTTMYTPITGEINILRYLSRIGPNEFNYEIHPNVNEFDILFDLCYQFINENDQKNRQNLMRSIASRLNSNFYGDTQISVVDVAVYSTIKQSRDAAKSLPPKFTKWQKEINQIAGY